MWRHDSRRSAITGDALPAELHLRWSLQLSPPLPAWPDDPRLHYDLVHEPVVAGKTLYLGSSRDDCVLAVDTESGSQKWRFYADGPVRFAPAIAAGTVYFVSDDGHLYALRALDGGLLWKFRGGPGERKVLGNGRLISAWPARGAPVIADGKVYFAASVWPFMGVFVHCLDAQTGTPVWTNGSSGSLYAVQPHNSPAFAGLAPQGYLAVAGDKLLVPNGRSAPACLQRDSGRLLYFHLGRNTRKEDYFLAAATDTFVNGEGLYLVDGGAALAKLTPGFQLLDESTAYEARCVLQEAADGSFAAKLDVKAEQGDVIVQLDERELRVEWDSLTPGFRYRLEMSKGRLGKLVKIGGDTETGVEVRTVRLKRDYTDLEGQVRRALEVRFRDGPGAGIDRPAKVVVPGMREHKTYICLDPGRWECFAEDHVTWRETGAAAGGLDPGSADTEGIRTERVRIRARLPDLEDVRRKKGRLGASVLLKTRARGVRIEHRKTKLWDLATSWKAVSGPGVSGWRPRTTMIKAGSRLYAGGPGKVLVIERQPGAEARVSSLLELDGVPGSLVAADGKLFVSTLEGKLHCFAGTAAAAVSTGAVNPAAPASPERGTSPGELDATGVRDGYCLVFGLGSGELVEDVLRQSDLQVIAVDPDARKVDALRRRLHAEGLHGVRAAVHVGDPLAFAWPPYLASLIISGDLEVAGLGAAVVGPEGVHRAFEALRPYGGVLCLALPDGLRQAFRRAVDEARLEGARVRRVGRWTLLERVGRLPGSGDWTHQYGDAANSCVSPDALVKPPLGLLWFGGPSHREILPRHGHGPSEQVVGGRLIIEGPDILRAVDVYTGRLLWQVSLPGVGAAYNNTSHQPGANSLGSNYASVEDGIYVAMGELCLRLDPANGARLSEFRLPRAEGETGRPRWGAIAVWEELLVAGASPMQFFSTDYHQHELQRLKLKPLLSLARHVEAWRDFDVSPRGEKDSVADFLVENLNRILGEEFLEDRIPGKVKAKADKRKVRSVQKDIRAHLTDKVRTSPRDPRLRELNRRLLGLYYPSLPPLPVTKRRGDKDVWDGTASKRLVALDRFEGNALWNFEADLAFRHNSIAVGGGKVFSIDRLPLHVAKRLRRRGRQAHKPERLLALDARTGELLWSTAESVFGTWLGYSREHDILLQAGRDSRDMLPDEPKDRMIAYRGKDGKVEWDISTRYSGPCMLHHDTVITQEKAFHLLTGKEKRVSNPITDQAVPWSFARHYGCAHAVASEHLLTFRSAAAGFFDLSNFGGTGNLGGFRAGCTSNLIAANGVLNAPDYTRTCTCSYQNQTSLALVHVPELEFWTFNGYQVGKKPVQRLGINLGAPGDRRVPEGTLWLEYPVVGGPSPDVQIRTRPEKPDWFRTHSALVEGDGPSWVASSGLRDLNGLTVKLVPGGKREVCYTVRLDFVEPDDAAPGERVFSVRLQDSEVLEKLDIVQEAGGRWRGVRRQFQHVRVVDDLKIELLPVGRGSKRGPILCGVEVLAEDGKVKSF